MEPVPVTWPIGDGPDFLGIYHRGSKEVHLFTRTARNETAAPEAITTLDDPRIREGLSDSRLAELRTNVGLLDALDLTFDRERFLQGQQTPVYFGSALTNFGVRLFLDDFVDHAPSPRPYPSDSGHIPPDAPSFSGFVFKIQANMDPRHRDSVAFVRICSGRFERGMTINHVRTGRTVRLSRSYKFFAEDRETIEYAYAGDIVGLPGKRDLAIGDTVTEGETVRFDPIPRFPPEHFARLINLDIGKYKQFRKGLRQLETEGAMQILYQAEAQRREPILAVVGVLQYDVVQARLRHEYGVPTRLEPLPFQVARWIEGPDEEIEKLSWGSNVMLAQDRQGRLMALFSTPFLFDLLRERHPAVQFGAIGQALEN